MTDVLQLTSFLSQPSNLSASAWVILVTSYATGFFASPAVPSLLQCLGGYLTYYFWLSRRLVYR